MKVTTKYRIDNITFQTKYKKVIIFQIQNKSDIAYFGYQNKKITKGMAIIRVRETLHGKLVKEFAISNARLERFIEKHDIKLATTIRR